MRKILYAMAVLTLFASCHKSLEDRAAEELSNYTKKDCPTPVVNNVNVDSAVYEPATRTLHYYYKMHDKLDNKDVISLHKKEMRNAILKELKADTRSKVYKDAGFIFRYTYRSSSNPNTILLDESFAQKDYK